MNRRHFLRHTGAAAAGTLAMGAFPVFFSAPPTIAGVQLFTFFDTIDDDVEGTLKRIRATGYGEVESAFSHKPNFYGLSATDFAGLVKKSGLSWTSHHVLGTPFKLPPGAKMPLGKDGKPISIGKVSNLKDNMQELVDAASAGGVPYLVCANISLGTSAEIKEAVSILNKTDEACKKAGITFVYHNHDWEFKPVEGKIPYSVMLADTQIKMELDLAWALKGGTDPVELFRQQPGRFPLWHVKDLDKEMTTILPVGSGTIDYKRIFDKADAAGMKHFFVEHDMPKDPWDSITKSFGYLKKLVPLN